MRATTNGISSLAGFFAFQFASVSTSLRRTFFPSQLRSTDSRTIRMLTGNREIFPIPCSSSAGSENRKPSRPWPASNFLSALNSSRIQLLVMSSEVETSPATFFRNIERFLDSARNDKGSFQFRKFGLDPIEIRQLPCVVVALCILDHAVLIDDERRSFRHAAHSKVHLRQERVVHHAVLLRDFVFIVAQQRHRNLFLLRPCFLRKRIVAADSVNSGVQADVCIQARADFTHLLRARARERHRKEKQKRVLVSKIVAKPDLLRPVRDLGGQHEIRRFGSNCKWHKQSSGLSFRGKNSL